MNINDVGLPLGIANALGISRSSDKQFEDVLGAFARSHRRIQPPTPEQLAAFKREAKRNDPRHIKALAKRRKRKRGGPK